MSFHKNKVFFTISTATLLSLSAITGCGTTTTTTPNTSPVVNSTNQTLNIGLSADPPTLDPAYSSALVDRQVMFNLYNTLFKLSTQNTIVPDLVKSFTVSQNGLTYTLQLHQHVTFQDGTPFNAAAVKFNLTRDMQPASARHSSLSDIASVTTPSEYTVVIQLQKPLSPLPAILAGRAGMMVSPTAVQKEGANYPNDPVGTGPFEFKSRVKGASIQLVRNPHYWRAEPKLEAVTYQIFTDPNVELTNLQSGAVQIVDTVPPQEVSTMEQNSNFTVVNHTGLGYEGIYLNMQQGPFTNPYLRQAVNLAINRQTLVNVALKGVATAAYSPFSSASPVYNQQQDTPPTPNAVKIKKLLAEGGKPQGFQFTLQSPNDPITTQVDQIMQSMLAQYGINMKIEQLDFGTLLANNEAHSFQASFLGWSGRLDPDQDVYSFFYSNGSFNASEFSNVQADQLLNQAREETSMAERAKTYAAFVHILHQQVPYVFLYHQNNVFAYANTLQGFHYYSDGVIRAYRLSLS